MTDQEKLAQAVGLVWMEHTAKAFPDLKLARFPAKGDIRKSLLFKHCIKFVRETPLPADDYRYYVQAQLAVLGKIETNGLRPLITPACLHGPQAWKRWKLWESKFRKAEKAAASAAPTAADHRLRTDLSRTRTFLLRKLGEPWVAGRYAGRERDVERWVALGKVSSWYAVLSPWFRQCCSAENAGVDPLCYEVTAGAVALFFDHFPEEKS